MGRPQVSDPRNHQVNFSFTEAEIDLLRRRADQAEMRLVDYGLSGVLPQPVQPIVRGGRGKKQPAPEESAQ